MKNTLTVRITALICSAVLLCALLAAAGCSGSRTQIIAEGKVDNLRWVLDDSGCLSFTGTGAIPGVEYALDAETGLTQTIYPGWYEHRGQITEVIIGGGIDSISMNAFMYFPALRVMDIAATVSTIDGYAVSGCTALERVTIRCASVDMEKFCIGFTGGAADSNLESVTFVGASGSQVEKYAADCGAKFSKL